MGFWNYNTPAMTDAEYATINADAATATARRLAYIAETGLPNTITTIVPDDYEPDGPRHCGVCDSTDTIELFDTRQSITVCAQCGNDE